MSVQHGAQREQWLPQSVCTVYNLLDVDTTVFNNTTGDLFNQKLIHFTLMRLDFEVNISRHCVREIKEIW